jgi:hypothetical protein
MVITYVNNVLIFDVCVDGTALESPSRQKWSLSIVEMTCQQPCKSALKITNFLKTKSQITKKFYPFEGPFYVRTVSIVLIKLSDSEITEFYLFRSEFLQNISNRASSAQPRFGSRESIKGTISHELNLA